MYEAMQLQIASFQLYKPSHRFIQRSSQRCILVISGWNWHPFPL